MNGIDRADRTCALGAQRAHGRRRGSGFISLALLSLLASAGAAQQENAASFSAADQQAAIKAVLSNRQVRSILGAGEPLVVAAETDVDKSEAEAFVEGSRTEPPARRLSVLLWNRKTGKAARALLAIPGQQLIEAVPVSQHDVPIVREEVEEALALVKADAAAQRAAGIDLARFHVSEPGSTAAESYVAQALPLRGSQPSDPCTEDRCLDLVFRVEDGYLPLRAHVDLTRRLVEVEGSGARGAHHE
jgi:hypothetical protein